MDKWTKLKKYRQAIASMDKMIILLGEEVVLYQKMRMALQQQAEKLMR
jgi:hypothetical protein